MHDPNVSIVIPVYNVEPYLAKCLDSVVGQTMWDIQIICIDDGSTDRSPEILDEYAARDSRITVVHQSNMGPAATRNAAFPLIQGKFTLFVDSDDYVENRLCEQVVPVAERERADMTFFLHRSTSHQRQWTYLEDYLERHPFSAIDKRTLLSLVSPCLKLWRSHFLLDNRITFPDGIRLGEDAVVHWHALLLNPRLAIVPEHLYWYRVNHDSITLNKSSPRYMDVVPCYDAIKQLLVNLDRYEGEWKEIYHMKKLCHLESFYRHISSKLKRPMLDKIRVSIDDDDRLFLKNTAKNPYAVPWFVRNFYASLDGSSVARIKYQIDILLADIKHFLQWCFAICRDRLGR